MSRSQESFNKKEVRKKKEKKRKDKEIKKLTRKDNDNGSFDNMIAYVDENGMITSTPPDPSKKIAVKLEDIEISIPKSDPNQVIDPIRKGSVTFFNTSKGFGFIRDLETQESVFVHVNNLLEDIKEGNLVNYEVEMGQKGPTAVQVKLYKEPKPVAAPPPAPPKPSEPEILPE